MNESAFVLDTPEKWYSYRDTMKSLVVKSNRGEVKIPAIDTVMVKWDLIQANTYNPNGMPDQKVEDLIQSILLSGVAYGVAAWWDPDLDKFVIVDGFHRWLVLGYAYLGLEYIPIVPLDLTAAGRMMATWQFNKARGFHEVDLDADLIRALIGQGVSEDEICERLGIDLDTVYRYKQVTGIAELFQTANYSMAWEMVEVSGDD